MSRYSLDPVKPEHAGYEIAIGWDGLLANFFVQVSKPAANSFDLGGGVVICVAEHREATLNRHFHEVMTAVSPYAVVDDELKKTLWADSRKEGFGIRV